MAARSPRRACDPRPVPCGGHDRRRTSERGIGQHHRIVLRISGAGLGQRVAVALNGLFDTSQQQPRARGWSDGRPSCAGRMSNRHVPSPGYRGTPGWRDLVSAIRVHVPDKRPAQFVATDWKRIALDRLAQQRSTVQRTRLLVVKSLDEQQVRDLLDHFPRIKHPAQPDRVQMRPNATDLVPAVRQVAEAATPGASSPGQPSARASMIIWAR